MLSESRSSGSWKCTRFRLEFRECKAPLKRREIIISTEKHQQSPGTTLQEPAAAAHGHVSDLFDDISEFALPSLLGDRAPFRKAQESMNGIKILQQVGEMGFDKPRRRNPSARPSGHAQGHERSCQS